MGLIFLLTKFFTYCLSHIFKKASPTHMLIAQDLSVQSGTREYLQSSAKTISFLL